MPTTPPDGKSRRCRATPLPEHEWDRVKPVIYNEYKKRILKDLQAFMKREYQFDATEQQYKRKFGSWGIDKYIRADEMDRLIADPMAKQASNGKKVTDAQKRRYLRRKSFRAGSIGDPLSPASMPDTFASRLLEAEEVADGGFQAHLPTNVYTHDDESMESTDPSGRTMFGSSGLAGPTEPRYGGPVTGLTRQTPQYCSKLHLALSSLKQRRSAEIKAIRDTDVSRWTKVHFAILWHFTLSAWPSAICHRHYPIDSDSWKWCLETGFSLDDVFSYTQMVPDTFAEHHLYILAALLTVRYWAKAGPDLVSNHFQLKPFCNAVAIVAIRQACSCLYEKVNADGLLPGVDSGKELLGFSDAEESRSAHSEMFQTIERDLTAAKFRLWEHDIFQYVDYLRQEMRIYTPVVHVTQACEVLRKYLPHAQDPRATINEPYPQFVRPMTVEQQYFPPTFNIQNPLAACHGV